VTGRLKGETLRIASAAVIAAVLGVVAGCGTPGDTSGKLTARPKAAAGKPVLFTVDFEPGQTLRYKFVSSRKITLDWDPRAAAGTNKVQEQMEQLEMVVAYTPAEVDPYGISTIRATCESVKATRAGGAGRRLFGADAVETAQGKTFMIKMDPRGKIIDNSELRSLVQEMGKSAFRGDSESRRIKEPDMIGDFIASQWFLWDAVSSVEQPAGGVSAGQTWPSQLSVPTPMVMRKARDVTYRLEEIRQTDGGRAAVIKSTYTLAQTAPAGWPVPYSGRFQMAGTFGFLSGYDVTNLAGEGQELFNLDAGRVENYQQQYTVEMEASLPPMGIQASPHIRIDQTLTMERIENKSGTDNPKQ
jgi:hypothetical protein